MIRQAISCDICGNEKRQTNHWFVAYEQGGELRVSGWNSRVRSRAGTKHLCGQTCLHKLVDDFIANSAAARSQSAAAMSERTSPAATGTDTRRTDTSLTLKAAHAEGESAARMIAPVRFPVSAAVAAGPQPEVLAIPERANREGPIPPPEPRYASRDWRAEAWQRERERELRAAEHHPQIARRRSSA